MWELQCVGIAIFGSFGVRELLFMGVALYGVWELRCAGVAVCRSCLVVWGNCSMWELQCEGVVVCGSYGARELQCA